MTEEKYKASIGLQVANMNVNMLIDQLAKANVEIDTLKARIAELEPAKAE